MLVRNQDDADAEETRRVEKHAREHKGRERRRARPMESRVDCCTGHDRPRGDKDHHMRQMTKTLQTSRINFRDDESHEKEYA
eukprot:6203521-Pleurochrysis_carterae.AAC.3